VERITSVQNNKIKEAAALKDTKARKASGLFIAEGRKLVCELVRSGITPIRCFVKEGASIPCDIGNAEVYEVTDAVMKKMSALTTPQDVIAIAKQPQRDENPNDCFVVALDNIQDPLNLGAILRSAEAFGVKTVVLGHGCVDPFSQKTLRGAMGSAFRLDIVSCNLKEYLLNKKEQGFCIIGTGLDKQYVTVDRLCDWQKKVAVIGNEGGGISLEIREVCDVGMFIPMSGQNESLNAAVAASIIMWENQRQTNER